MKTYYGPNSNSWFLLSNMPLLLSVCHLHKWHYNSPSNNGKKVLHYFGVLALSFQITRSSGLLKQRKILRGGKRVRFQQRNHRPQWHLCFQIFCPVVRPWVSTLDLETMEVVNIVSGKELAGKGRLSERKPPKFKEIWDVERQIWGCFLLYYVSGIGKVELLLACILSWREIKE